MMARKKAGRKPRTVAEQISYLNPTQVSAHPWQAIVATSHTDDFSQKGVTQSAVRTASYSGDFQTEDGAFEDLDYMLPEQVRQVLAKEGLAKVSLDSVLRDREKLHKRAKYISREVTLGEIERRHPKPQPHVKPTPRTTFPSIKAKQTSSDVEEHATTHEPKTEEHPAQSRQWAKVKSQRFRLPSLQAHADAAMTSGLAAQAREDISKVATNIEEMNFRSEQYQERLATYDHKGFIQPRIVLVSSKVPRCNSMKRAIRKENNVQFIVYDFDKWSFNDILDAVSDRLNSYHRGCKAHSVLLLCQGGNGYAYLLKNFVLTPQKVKRVDYKPLREFWFDLGALISKIKPEEALIYIVGCVSDVDKQGRDLLNALRKLIYPLRVQIESPQEGTEQGKVALKQYFHYRRFLLWRSFMDGNDQNAELDPLRSRIDTERIMTWAELAEDADSD
ncbi:uncharacterized protein LOC121384681 isoform X2 [Gigantopelta aegis]|uniref:uncharacterized protein LOC121384681 isoform X2 n=1 Tax=Gigantopelta aegis TaxID=1735272 RepID=UPI001B88C644|nr:uncharacterized protein LOC121384681 isoform X2 [Gigantopelta aegis]